MNDNGVFPRTLIETVKHFADPDVAVEFLAKIRWPKGPACPHCGSKKVCFLKTRRVFKCTTRPCRKQFSIKVGTIFEDSAVGLAKWLPAVWMIANCKNGISSWELHRALGVTQKTAWFMLHRVRLAMQSRTFEKLSGKVEVDETFIGGKARNMHADKRKEKIHGRGAVGKAIVMGMLERRGKVKATVVKNRKKGTLEAQVGKHVTAGSEVHTDDLASYEDLSEEYIHEVINHAEAYVRGRRTHERHGELLELAKEGAERHLRERRAVSLIPLSRRAGLSVQRPAWRRLRPLPGGAEQHRRAATHL